jgi:hypothetical protein
VSGGVTQRLIVFDRVGIMDRTNFYAPGAIGKTRRLTPEGFMVCEGVAIARTGEQRYHSTELPFEGDATTGEIIVMRLPEEVFSAQTMASFEGKPVTIEHPNEFVTPDSWKRDAVGTVQNVRQGKGIEDDMLIADLLITDGEAIAFVNRKRPELSCGYDAEYEQTMLGHAIQRNIIGNHVALLTDRGRAGPRCAIRDTAAFDPSEPRDTNGQWFNKQRHDELTAIAVKRSKNAVAHSKAAGNAAALTASRNARGLTEKAQQSGKRADHTAAREAHRNAAALAARNFFSKSTKSAAVVSHKTAESAHRLAMTAHESAIHHTPDNLGDSSMKSRFADKFIRVMQAFSAKDAVALDRELATDGRTRDDDEDEETMDGRIKDALDWIDAQRKAAKDAAEEKMKKEKDCDEEDKKKKAEDAQKAKDSAAALEAARSRDVGVLNTADAALMFKHIFARAEILSPGIAVPTGDAAATKDALPALMLKAVKAAYSTDAGKAVIDPFLLGSGIDAVTLDNVSGVFTGSAELMRQRNNRDTANTKLSVKDFGKAVSPSTLNERNREFWAKQQSGR